MNHPADGDRFFDESLQGHEAAECPIPRCGAQGRMKASGWLEYGGAGTAMAGWWVEAVCPEHGPGRVSVSRLRLAVEAALAAAGRGGSMA